MRLAVTCATALVVLAPGALRGQGVTAELSTVTPYGNFAREGNRQDFASWPVGTLIPSPGSSIGANTGNAFADTIVGWRVRGSVVSADVSEQGGGQGPLSVGSTPSLSASNVQQGPHALRLRIRGLPGLRGKVEVWASGLAMAGSIVTMLADIGDNGSVEFGMAALATGSFGASQWTAVLDQNGDLPVRITTDARATLTSAGNTVYKVGISVRFTPGSFCDMVTYGASCGPGLTGSDDVVGQTRELTLQLAQAPALAPGVLIAGTQRLNLTIPGTACRLLTDPAVAVPIITDANGFVRQVLRAPFGPAVAANLQAGVLGSGGLTSSNGIAIICR